MTTTNGGNAATRNKPLAVIALALALILSAMPQVATAHHCGGSGHNPNGSCFRIPDLNPTPPTPPVEIPMIEVPDISRDVEKDSERAWLWIAGGAVVIGLIVAGMENKSAFAPGVSPIPQGWQLSDELGGIGVSRFITDDAQLTFATDLPNNDNRQMRAEIKFSF